MCGGLAPELALPDFTGCGRVERRGGSAMKRSGLFALVAVCFACSGTAYGQTLKVLVTNDDGITAEGISALVSELIANPNLDVTVIAPATNQSGTGDNLTLPPNQIGVSAGTTAAGYGRQQPTTY